MPRFQMEARIEGKNARLRELTEPPLEMAEMTGARLYTGPMFIKYNGVLRGLDSDVAFLKDTMVKLCCATDVAMRYSNGEVAYEVARKQLNTYTTSLHAINSAIVKLSKLTVATKVYRGVGGRVLPPEFWEANSFGVRGGIEVSMRWDSLLLSHPLCSLTCTLLSHVPCHMLSAQGAFMSTTTDAKVAMEYAAKASGAGFIFEIQQGMIDRGADISFLSQYPHEQEIV